MGTRYERTIAGYHAFGTYPFCQRCQRSRKDDVIDAESHDDVPDACLSKHVTFETCQARLAEGCPKWTASLSRAVIQQAIADDALIQDAHFRLPVGAFLQPLCKIRLPRGTGGNVSTVRNR